MKRKMMVITLTAAMLAGITAAPVWAEEAASDEGKVLNIYCWNEEFKSRLTDHYPGYEEVDGTHGKIGDVNVVWKITPSDDNAYQNNLDETLLKQADAAADDKIDLFLVEADYALKYVNTEYFDFTVIMTSAANNTIKNVIAIFFIFFPVMASSYAFLYLSAFRAASSLLIAGTFCTTAFFDVTGTYARFFSITVPDEISFFLILLTNSRPTTV